MIHGWKGFELLLLRLKLKLSWVNLFLQKQIFFSNELLIYISNFFFKLNFNSILKILNKSTVQFQCSWAIWDKIKKMWLFVFGRTVSEKNNLKTFYFVEICVDWSLIVGFDISTCLFVFKFYFLLLIWECLSNTCQKREQWNIKQTKQKSQKLFYLLFFFSISKDKKMISKKIIFNLVIATHCCNLKCKWKEVFKKS